MDKNRAGRRLVIFAREPRAGETKTRLARHSGVVAAASWQRRQNNFLIRRIGFDRRWKTIIAANWPREGIPGRCWPESIDLIPQGRGDLGDRMKRVFLESPPGPVIIVGSDIPELSAASVERAFRELQRGDAVFGPSPDGGFWLVGFKRIRKIHPAVFENVRWSTEYALEDSVATLPELKIVYADTLEDMDATRDIRRAAAQRKSIGNWI